MSEWFEWRGENFYPIRGEELFFLGSAIKRDGEDKWEAFAHGWPVGVFISESAARQRVEQSAAGFLPPRARTWNRGELTEPAKAKWRLWRRLNGNL